MGTIKDEAMAYEGKQTKTIDLLDKVPVDLVLKDDSFEFVDEETGKTKDVHQKVCTVDGEDYRVPRTVLRDLKIMFEDNPNLKFFKVKKKGEGKMTRYTVIPSIA